MTCKPMAEIFILSLIGPLNYANLTKSIQVSMGGYDA
jgi:hypothetical protein